MITPLHSSIPLELERALSLPCITDICINGPNKLYIDQGQGMELWPLEWNDDSLKDWIFSILSDSKRAWDARSPYLDLTWNQKFRFHILFPPLSGNSLQVSIRRLSNQLPNQVQTQWKSMPGYSILKDWVVQKKSFIIAGSTGSGKSTLLQLLIDEIPSNERILAIEDTPELFPSHPHFLSLQSRLPNADGFGGVDFRALLKQCLRMRPDRILLGECRGGEVLDLLQALNTGHSGTLCTLHANHARDALRRLELLCLLAPHANLSSSVIRELLVSGIHGIAMVNRSGTNRIISEIFQLEGKEGDTLLMRKLSI